MNAKNKMICDIQNKLLESGFTSEQIALLESMVECMISPGELYVKRSERAKQFPLLHYKKDGDVGLDLPVVFDTDHHMEVIFPGERATIPTGIFLEIPRGYWAAIEARSSTSQDMLIVPKGVIDEGYRGELFAVLLNVGNEPVVIKHGDRLVQLIISRREQVTIVEKDELSPSERGATGFGSTGRNENTIE